MFLSRRVDTNQTTLHTYYIVAKDTETHKSSHEQRVERRRQFYHSYEAQAIKHRSFFTQIADDLTAAFGSTTFLTLNIIFFTAWVVVNIEIIPDVPPFDPFPFGLLTMVVSLEAIILSIVILVSQNRQAYVSSLREELHLQVNLIAEEEITKVLKLLAEIRQKMGIDEEDPELNEMVERINTSYIERSLVEQIEKANTALTKRIAGKLNAEFPDILTHKNSK